MPIRFACPRCTRVYAVSSALAGRRARCAQCQQKMRIPRLPVSSPLSAAISPGGRQPVKHPPQPGTMTLVRIPPLQPPPVMDFHDDEEDGSVRSLPSAALAHTGDEPVVYERASDSVFG